MHSRNASYHRRHGLLSLDRQRQAQELLRQLDAALTADAGVEEAVQQHAIALRDNLFGAFQFIERESLQCRTLLVQTKRVEANQLQVQVRGRALLALLLDAELGYDQRAPARLSPSRAPAATPCSPHPITACCDTTRCSRAASGAAPCS